MESGQSFSRGGACYPMPAQKKNFRAPRFSTLEKEGDTSAVSSSEVKIKTCCLHPEAVSHFLGDCRKFINMDVQQRWDVVKEHHLCFCCLGIGHGSRQCELKRGCNRCSLPHHILLHKAKPTESFPLRSSSTKGNTAPKSMDLQKISKQMSKPEAKRPSVVGVVSTHRYPKENIALMVLTTMKKKALVANFNSLLLSMREQHIPCVPASWQWNFMGNVGLMKRKNTRCLMIYGRVRCHGTSFGATIH